MELDVDQMMEEGYVRIAQATSCEELEELRIKYIGRKGLLTEALGRIAECPAHMRPEFGKKVNQHKKKFSELLDQKKNDLASHKNISGNVDMTAPGIGPVRGKRHPLSCVMHEITDIFLHLGFRIVEGPEIETEFHNFEALNIPLDHPSRDAFDTFYLRDNLVLRSHTSPVQIRVMETTKPPLKVIAPGRVYRPDAVDATHSFMFHQIEGLMVDEGVHFGHLKWVLECMAKELFGSQTTTRFRPHFFPFTEPSAEVDVSCVMCQGKGCRVCKQTGWLEILGAGMVNPAVFKAVGYDPERYTGFAFGLGVERIAMLKYGIDDMRIFFENDVRFLQQIGE